MAILSGLILPHRGIYTPPPALLIPQNGGFQSLDGMERFKKLGSGGGGGGTLQDDVPSTCFCIESSNNTSYGGSGVTFANNIASPADGTAQTDWDLYRGDGSTSSTYPTFNGSAGSPGAYFSNDGGDYFKSKQASDVSVGFMNKIHRTDDTNGFWLAFSWRFSSAATNHIISNGNATADYGFRIQVTTSLLRFGRFRNSTVQTTDLINSAGSFVNGTDYLVIISMNSSRTNFRFWKNTRTNTSMAPAAAWSAVTSNASHRFYAGAGQTLAAFDPSGTRYYGYAGGQDYLDNTAAGKIFDYFNTSTGITFA